MNNQLWDLSIIPINNIDDCAKAAWQHAENAGFHATQREGGYVLNVLAKSMLTVTELSELVEAIRHGESVESVREELADALIRLLDLDTEIVHHYEELNGKDLPDLSQVIYDKMVKNLSRGHRHGGKAV